MRACFFRSPVDRFEADMGCWDPIDDSARCKGPQLAINRHDREQNSAEEQIMIH